MPKPRDKSGETTRLQMLHLLHMLNAPGEERFQHVTRLAKRLFGTPVAHVSLERDSVPFSASALPHDVAESPAAAAITKNDVFVVHDTLLDPRYRDDPLVTTEPGVRFYAGCPIDAPGGARAGTFYILDLTPRLFTVEEMEMLCELAGMVEANLENITHAVTDELTRLANRRGFLRTAERLLRLCANHNRPAALLLFDLDGLKRLNDEGGHAEGDRAIRDFGRLLLKTFRHSDVIARLGGDEFCVFAADIDGSDLGAPLHRLSERVRSRNLEDGRKFSLDYSVGTVVFDPARHHGIEAILKDADRRMYEQKRRKGASGVA